VIINNNLDSSKKEAHEIHHQILQVTNT
jgi:hypothetical protein